MTDGASDDLELRALRLFEECLDRPESERDAFLRRMCGDDEALRSEVMALRHVDESGDGIDVVALVPDPEALLADPTVSSIRLGPWRVEARIGVGGMGEVYRGRRGDGAFDRTVAIKRVRPGFGDGEILSRFMRERRVLAALEHPNIARLIDAGSDDQGIPYLVMEYVDGERIDRFCDERRLSSRDRVELFLKVCDAVHHAHRVGVIHRDLKPANILVNADGEPKLLDFGIAGVLDAQREGEAPAIAAELTLTGESFGFMTPAYASPEQLRRAPVRAASDQYSLAVVLYQLLTGVLPHDLSSLSPAEIERVVNHDPAPLPSAAAARARTDATAPEARAGRREVTVASMRRALRGDLDRILMMALRKEPHRRYASVEDFASDLRRYLRGHPVRAQRDTVLYRASRFVRRNRIPVAVATIVIVAISSALVVALRALKEAEDAGERARLAQGQAEAGLADADAVTDFLSEMLGSGDPWEMGKDVRVRDVLDRTAGEVESKFGSRPLIAARLHLTLGRAYLRLGVHAPARVHSQRGHELVTALLPDDDPRVRDSYWLMGMVHKGAKDYDEALRCFRRHLEITRAIAGDDAESVYVAEIDVGGVLRASGRFAEAEASFRATIDGLSRVSGSNVVHMSQVTNNLGLLLMEMGRLTEAREWMERSAELHAMHFAPDHPEALIGRANLCSLLIREQRPVEAERLARELVEDMTSRLGRGHPNTLIAMSDWCRSLFHCGRAEEALQYGREVLELSRAGMGDRSIESAYATIHLAEYVFQDGGLAEAEELTYEAMVLFEALASPREHYRAHSLRAHGAVLTAMGDRKAGIELLERSVGLLRAFRPADPDLAMGYRNLYEMWVKVKRYDLALIWALHWLGEAPEERAAGSDRMLVALGNLATFFHKQGLLDRAEEFALEAYYCACDRFGPYHDVVIGRAEQLAVLYRLWRSDRADVWATRAAQLRDARSAQESGGR